VLALIVALCLGRGGIREILREQMGVSHLSTCTFTLIRPKGSQAGEWMLDVLGRPGRLLRFLYHHASHSIEERPTLNIEFDRQHRPYLVHMRLDGSWLKKAMRGRYGERGLGPAALFRDLEALATLGLFYRVSAHVHQYGKIIPMEHMSEGEHQFVSLLGLLLATNEHESLLLLDEPDTHLNPNWSRSLVQWLGKAGEESPTSQIIIATHNPLTFAGFQQEQVILLRRDRIRGVTAESPRYAPRGMGVNLLLTGDFYRLPSALDPQTQASLERRRVLEHKLAESHSEERQPELPESLAEELRELQDRHWRLGLFFHDRDPAFSAFERAVAKRPIFMGEGSDEERLALATEILDDLTKRVD